MKRLTKSRLAFVIVLALLIAMLPMAAVSAAGEPTVIKHTFGGANGEWELDTDNSQGVWSYYTSYGTLSTIQPTVLQLTADQNGRTTGEAYYALNKDGFMHPGASDPWSMPVVALTMEASGTLNAVMSGTKTDGGGNGVVVKFFKNDDSGLLVEQALVAADSYTMEATVEVEAGDVIYFLVHHNNDIACDGVTYVLDYTLTVAAQSQEPSEEPSETPTVAPNSKVIKHTFGGANGEWELDTDNSTGIWSYYTSYGMISSIQETVLQLTADQNGRTTGEAYYAMNKDGFMHPGASSPWSMPVIALTMEQTGTLKAVMNATKNEGAGNGVVVKFFKNDDAGRLVEKTLVEAGSHTMEAEVAVEKGDVIYFLVHHNNDIASDGATYVLDYTLTYIDKTPVSPAPTGDTFTALPVALLVLSGAAVAVIIKKKEN